jgi:hypothetical protein
MIGASNENDVAVVVIDPSIWVVITVWLSGGVLQVSAVLLDQDVVKHDADELKCTAGDVSTG